MRASIRIIQALVILLTSFIVCILLMMHNYVTVFGAIAACIFSLCMLQVAGIDQTLKNLQAKKYAQIGFAICGLVIFPPALYLAVSAAIAGQYASAAKLLSPIFMTIGILVKYPEFIKSLFPWFFKK